jgi:hypothetical protein
VDSANSISLVPKSPRKTKTKTRRVRVSVDESSPGALRLAVLLKEVLQQIPDEDAKALMDAYVSGKAIVVAMAQNSGGSGCKTAFQCATGMHEPGTEILHHEFNVESESEGQLRQIIVLPCGLVAAKKRTLPAGCRRGRPGATA